MNVLRSARISWKWMHDFIIYKTVTKQLSSMQKNQFLTKNASALGYRIIVSEETVTKMTDYKSDLIDAKTTAGSYLRQKLSGVDIKSIREYEFMELLLSTKKPQIFAEQEVRCDGTDWNCTEFAILGDISVAVKAVAYDNGIWDGRMSSKYDTPLDVELLYTPGTMLNTGNTGSNNNPDYKEVTKNGKISQENYSALIQRRLLPVLSYVDNQVGSEKKALVVIPGLGCGNFAGRFRGKLENCLDTALQAIIEKHKFQNIKGIYLGFYGQPHNIKKEINGIIYVVKGNGVPQLSHPQTFDEEFKDCKLYKVVAWDHVSLPGNDFFNNTRSTDDGVSAAATNSMEIITGVKGMYTKDRYLPPKGYVDWEDVAKSNNVKLIAKDNICVVSRDGQIIVV